MAHANARLTPAGRLTLVGRIAANRAGRSLTSPTRWASSHTAARWWGRDQQLGEAGLVDRPSIPCGVPGGPPPGWRSASSGCAAVSGSARPGSPPAWLPASTVHRVLVRHQLNRLAWLDRPTGRPIRRDEHPRPGDLVHLDTKKLGRIPAGVATESTAGPLGRSTVAPTGRAVAMTSCMPPSTTTPGWPMSRCWVTSGPRAAPGSGVAPTAGSPSMASRWSGS
jgi:hypothetical protein